MDSSLPKLNEMKDILDLKDIHAWSLGPLWIFVLILSVLLLGWALLAWFHRRKKRTPQEKPRKPLEIALKKLDDLVASRFLESGQVRRFYFGLSDIFREFIEREIGIMALETTLEELKPALKGSSELKPEEIRQACWFLDLSEMAKFAQYVPPKEEIIESVKVVRLWVTQVAKRREAEREKANEEQKVAS